MGSKMSSKMGSKMGHFRVPESSVSPRRNPQFHKSDSLRSQAGPATIPSPEPLPFSKEKLLSEKQRGIQRPAPQSASRHPPAPRARTNPDHFPPSNSSPCY